MAATQQRIPAATERQIEILAEDRCPAMREKAARVLDAKSIATGDLEKARKLAVPPDNQVGGCWRDRAAIEAGRVALVDELTC